MWFSWLDEFFLKKPRWSVKICLTFLKIQDNIFLIYWDDEIDPSQPNKPAIRAIDLTRFKNFTFLKLFFI